MKDSSALEKADRPCGMELNSTRPGGLIKYTYNDVYAPFVLTQKVLKNSRLTFQGRVIYNPIESDRDHPGPFLCDEGLAVTVINVQG